MNKPRTDLLMDEPLGMNARQIRAIIQATRLAALTEALNLTKALGASDAYRHSLQDLIYQTELAR